MSDDIVPTFTIEHDHLESKHYLKIQWSIGQHKYGIMIDVNKLSCQCDCDHD